MRRRDDGQPIRDAMRRADLSILRLAEMTKRVDPAHYGVSRSLIGALVATGSSARDACRPRSAALISAALDKPLHDLFVD
ncbi:XRE family transcriptional regulator [Embleya sp. NPDC001921]